MYLLENNKKQTDNNEKEIIDELNNDIIKEENKNEEINSEKVQKEENFNKIESQNEENKEELIVNEKKNEQNINKNNINLNLSEITIENNKTKSANHETIPECINNCINWTLKAHINKKNNPKEFKYNHNFQGKNLFFPKLEYNHAVLITIPLSPNLSNNLFSPAHFVRPYILIGFVILFSVYGLYPFPSKT